MQWNSSRCATHEFPKINIANNVDDNYEILWPTFIVPSSSLHLMWCSKGFWSKSCHIQLVLAVRQVKVKLKIITIIEMAELKHKEGSLNCSSGSAVISVGFQAFEPCHNLMKRYMQNCLHLCYDCCLYVCLLFVCIRFSHTIRMWRVLWLFGGKTNNQDHKWKIFERLWLDACKAI